MCAAPSVFSTRRVARAETHADKKSAEWCRHKSTHSSVIFSPSLQNAAAHDAAAPLPQPDGVPRAHPPHRGPGVQVRVRRRKRMQERGAWMTAVAISPACVRRTALSPAPCPARRSRESTRPCVRRRRKAGTGSDNAHTPPFRGGATAHWFSHALLPPPPTPQLRHPGRRLPHLLLQGWSIHVAQRGDGRLDRHVCGA